MNVDVSPNHCQDMPWVLSAIKEVSQRKQISKKENLYLLYNYIFHDDTCVTLGVHIDIQGICTSVSVVAVF